MKNIVFILTFFCSFLYSQSNQFHDQIYFIGEKIREESYSKNSQIEVIPASKQVGCEEMDKDGNCYPEVMIWEQARTSIESHTAYRIIKVIKGNYEEKTINSVLATYLSNPPIFEIQEGKKSKYVIVGVIRYYNRWYQCFIEKIYPTKDNKWILPYKDTYPFIDYEKNIPKKLKKSERIKITTDDLFYKTKHYSTPELVKPYYKKYKGYAVVITGFIF